MKLYFSIFLLFGLNTLSFASKKPERASYDWEENPTLTEVIINDTNTAFIYLKNFESREFFDMDNGSFTEYVLTHRKIKLLSDRGIEGYNKIYLPVESDEEFLIEKARVINSKGKVIELNKKDIKEGFDEESERKYRYFAFEGIDIGSEIEYIFMYNRYPKLTGRLKDVQQNFLQKNYGFEVIAPQRLVIDFKVYNSDLKFQFDSTLLETAEKRKWYFALDSVTALPNQRSSAHSAELIYFGYKLSKNYANNSSDLYSYGDLSKHVYRNLYETFTKKDEKFLKKLAKKIDFEDDATDFQKARAIEEFVKSNTRIVNVGFKDGILVEELWQAKILNEIFATKILLSLYDQHEIKCIPGLTSNRFKFKFDKDFELWTFADETVLWFPELDVYTTPNQFDRIGQMDFECFYNYGLFVKTVDLGGEKFGVGSVEFIPHNKYEDAGDTLRVVADFAKSGIDDTKFDVYHSISGYKAQYIQPYFEQIEDEEDKTEMKESLINFLDEDGKVEDLEVENLTIEKYGIEPVRATGKLTSNAFFEKARDNYLFKVGKLIGPQMEMYSEQERKLPVEEYFTRHYDRVIKFTVPEGYLVKNLEALEMNESFIDEDGKKVMEFVSTYKQEGNEITVHISEYYKTVYFPLEIFEDYQRVINAAADFNKVTVVFEKK
ncbi:MAG: DUF3857 domain-containing protein [Brumimicrobium sp.]|nr:DUF3857 domain-containing protein [Brumimicrobium sp.]